MAEWMLWERAGQVHVPTSPPTGHSWDGHREGSGLTFGPEYRGQETDSRCPNPRGRHSQMQDLQIILLKLNK